MTRPCGDGQLGQPGLDRSVGLDAAMAVEMVGADVRVHRNIRTAADGGQLQLTQLQHGPVLAAQGVRPLDQRRADVAAHHVRDFAGSQDGADHGRGGGLALGTGHGHDTGTRQAQEKLDLADQLDAGSLGGQQRALQPRIGGR